MTAGLQGAFLALGSTAPDALDRFDACLAALQDDDLQIVSAAPCVRGPFVAGVGASEASDGGPAVTNTVVRIATRLEPAALLARALDEEVRQGRVRDGQPERSLDIDVLLHGETTVETADLVVPHPRMFDRAFVLQPLEAIAPMHRLPGGHGTVVAAASRLRAQDSGAFETLEPLRAPVLPALPASCTRLEDGAALEAWRAEAPGSVGVVMTMGALHEGHLALVRHACAENDRVVVTLFVNPLQFGEGEDLARYPRTLEADEALLRQTGADAVYVPAPDDLYPSDFSTFIEPEGPAQGFEGARRPTHFRGVTTIVLKLWMRTRPDRAYFGRKDAQQVAVLTRMVRDLDLPGALCVVPTVHAADGLALSSRNRYLDGEARASALGLSRALRVMAQAAAEEARTETILSAGRAVLADAGLEVEYLAVVDAETMLPVETLSRPALAMGVVRVAATRLLDNRWLAFGGASAS